MAESLRRFFDLLNGILDVQQLLVVSYVAVAADREAEVVRNLIGPFAESFLFLLPVEGPIDFHSAKGLVDVGEPFLGRAAFVKGRAPMRIDPSASSDVDTACHTVFDEN